jgi:hypothetical protein
MAVYQSGRRADSGSFTYTIPGLTPDTAYLVRLHFAETYWGGPGQRKFNVAINGQQVLNDFDIFAAAGGTNIAIARSFEAIADATGTITIVFSNGSADEAYVNAIEVLQGTAVGNQLITGDFNGDGYVDFALVSNNGPSIPGQVNVFYNLKNGSFGPAEAYPVPLDGIPTAVAADLNNDGRIDIALLITGTGGRTVDAFLNLGNAAPGQRFQFVPNYWTLPASLNSDTLTGLTKADLNHDGLDDLLLGDTKPGYRSGDAGAVLVLLNNAQPSLRTVTSYVLPAIGGHNPAFVYQAGPVAVGDLNGDGNLDVIENGGMQSLEYNAFNVALGDGQGNLGPWMSYGLSVGQFPGPLSLADVKGDGSLSAVFLASAAWGYSSELALNRGNAVFDVVPQQNAGANPLTPLPVSVQLKDVNGDLKPDLVYLLSPLGGRPGTASLLVYLNTGTYPYFNVQNPLLFPLPNDASVDASDFAITDVNNDGLNDVLVSNSNRTAVSYLFLNTSPRKQPGIPVFLQAGSIAGGNDFLNVQTPAASAVHGQAYHDENRNRLQDTRETGAAGSFVFVDLNHNGKYDPGEPSAVTRANGVYTISGLADGTYSVGVVPEDGWKTTTAEFVEVTVDGRTAAQADFGGAQRLLGPVADQQVQQGAPLALPVPLALGTAGENLVYSLEGGAPVGAAIDPGTGYFIWTPSPATPPGSYAISVRVRDFSQPLRTETTTFLVHVTPAAPVTPPLPPSGLFAVPVLDDVVKHRRRPRGPRSQLLGATLIFNVPVNLDPRAVRLVGRRPGRRGQDFSRWIQVVTVVQNGQTWARLRFRSPRGGLLLPRGQYSLVLQNDLLRNALTGAPLATPGGGGRTELSL